MADTKMKYLLKRCFETIVTIFNASASRPISSIHNKLLCFVC